MASTSSHERTLQERITEKVGDAADAAIEQVKNAATSAAERASSGIETARQTAERTHEVAGTSKSALEKALRDQPRATLAGAVVFGFVFGALWKLTR